MARLSDHRILIVNDDGIHSPGIDLLERVFAAHAAEVWVVAPDDERSGASNSVSMHTPIRARKLGDRRFAVKGTPTDCVLMALYELMDERPTLILSGVNRGANLAEDVFYSGTVAAAMEGALLGIPSIALNQVFLRGAEVHWDTAERYVLDLVTRILDLGLPRGTLVNVNFPPRPASEISGIAVVRQGRRPPGSFKTEARVDCREVPYYWVKLRYEDGGFDEGTDLKAIRDGAIAVCPIQLDMTDYAFHAALDGALPAHDGEQKPDRAA